MLELFDKQLEYQKKVLAFREKTKDIPKDDVNWFSYHVQAMVEELGEMVKSDKRWKTHRNERYDKNEKYLELADVFITVLNLAIYSGLNGEEFKEIIKNKIEENSLKLKSLGKECK